jgi:hypothetical protein
MADFPGEAATFAGTAATERSGAIAGTDTVPVNTTLLLRNTGAGAHNVTLTVTATFETLTVPNRVINIPAGAIRTVDLPGDIGDANGRVAIAVNETVYAEVKYYVIGQ